MTLPKPSPLGLRRSFGFGDRLGLATRGHLAAARKFNFLPVFAQQSVRELERTGRTHAEVMLAAQQALVTGQFSQSWGADADHHKTEADLDKAVAAGFTLFTLDPAAEVREDADSLPASALAAQIKALEQEGAFPDPDWQKPYLKRPIALSPAVVLNFTPEVLTRSAVKYGRALAATSRLAAHLRRAAAERPFEIELALDETSLPTTPHEHLFVGLELKRRQVPLASLALRFATGFERGIDFRGDLKRFEALLRDHVNIARFCGPYKISVHSGSDKFSLYPVIGRVCGDLLHLKTAGTSYLEALRVIARTAPPLFAEIAEFCRTQFEADRRSYQVSTTLREVQSLAPFYSPKEEPIYFEQRVGRQLLDVTYGSVLSKGKNQRGQPFRDAIYEKLTAHNDLYQELLEKLFDKHLSLLVSG